MPFSTLQLHRLFKVHVISVTFFYLAQSSQVFLTLTCLSTLQKRLFIDIFISEKNKNDPTQPGMGLVLGNEPLDPESSLFFLCKFLQRGFLVSYLFKHV